MTFVQRNMCFTIYILFLSCSDIFQSHVFSSEERKSLPSKIHEPLQAQTNNEERNTVTAYSWTQNTSNSKLPRRLKNSIDTEDAKLKYNKSNLYSKPADVNTTAPATKIDHPSGNLNYERYKQQYDNNFQRREYGNTHGQYKSYLKTNDSPLNYQVNSLGDSPCSSHLVDGLYLVNCSGLSLSSFNSSWFPTNTNIVLLDVNKLKSISSFAFSHLRDLVQLSISGNRIWKIEEQAFDGLEKLEYLNLEDNDLNFEHSPYPPGVFDTLRNLKELRLMNNVKTEKTAGTARYPDNFLGKLESLEHLTIDSTGDTLFFGSEFRNLTKLSRLEITGNSRNIDETSFQNVRNITELYLLEFPRLINCSEEALQPLKKLNSLSFDGVRVGVTKSLLSLKPLVGTNMTTINLDSVDFFIHDSYSSFIMNDGVLGSTKTKYLLEICVNTFTLTRSSIYVLQEDAFAGPVWNRCLKSIDLSMNPLVGTKVSYVRIFNLKNIKTIIMEDRMDNCYFISHKKDNLRDPTNKSGKKLKLMDKQEKIIRTSKNAECSNSGTPQRHRRSELNAKSNSAWELHNKPAITSLPGIQHIFQADSGFFWAKISDSLQTVKLKSSIARSSLSENLKFIGAQNLTYLDLSFNKLMEFRGNITGFDGLQTFILSGNQMSSLSETFFDNFPLLKSLYLSECLLDGDFMLRSSGRVLRNLSWLKKVDISKNFLNFLASDTFRKNTNLEEVDLSINRFKTIPFNLKNTPILKMLDLQENSISTLGADHRNQLDQLAKQPGGFRLPLSGNAISCECDNLPFLLWMRTTDVQLDLGFNLRCAGDHDENTFVSTMNDLEGFWRKCNGHFFLYIATSLLLSMTIGFLTVFFVLKYGTYIKSSILKLFTGYKLKGPSDYSIGVYIGYSLSDYRYPCFGLTPFIEDVLGLSTFVFHRDMSSPDMASNTMDVINNSWRTILVFSESFLRDEWATFIYTCAIHSQTVENPSRVVVLVESSLQHELPAEILGAVVEDNIIVVPT